MTSRNATTLFFTGSLVMLVASGMALACNVPVFRYALERWRPDPYRAVLFHRGPLGESEKKSIAPLEEADGQSAANISLRTLDVDQLEAADRELLAQFENPKLPFLVLQYPANLRIEVPVWTGTLTAAAVQGLVDSPARKELIRQLADGRTAVWLLVECGDAQKDEAAAKLLHEQLQKLRQTLKLPELTDSVDDSLMTAAPLKVEFSLVRVPRGPAEQPLIEMLLRSEPDLAERSDPMVFPVFGRGRALFGLVGKGISAENIQNAAGFLVGACSCEVKDQNPGFDLLLSAPWDTLIFHEGDPPIESRQDKSSPASDSKDPAGQEAELVPIPRGSAPAPAAATKVGSNSSSPPTAVRASTDRTEPSTSDWPRQGAWVLIGCVVAAAAGTVIRRFRRISNSARYKTGQP